MNAGCSQDRYDRQKKNSSDAELVLVLRVARNQVRLCSLKGLARSPFPRRDVAPLHFGYDPMQQARPDHFTGQVPPQCH
jgi:hypothetical protein